jgi:bifunctional non-homologous end joining protein LigD
VRLPVFHPMLATAGPLPPRQLEWAFEVKWDGVRTVAYLDGAGGLVLRNRAGHSITARYPDLAALPDLLPGRDAILDAEIITADEHGHPDFNRLLRRAGLTRPAAIAVAARQSPASLVVFDVLWLDDRPLLDRPYTERRRALEDLRLAAPTVYTPPVWTGQGDAAWEWTDRHRLEGVVAKRLTGIYQPGARTADWIKTKHEHALRVTIGGWLPADERPHTLKSVLVGVPDGDTLRYLGAVGSGFTEQERLDLPAALRRLETPTPPFADPAHIKHAPHARWTHPLLTADVTYRDHTANDHLRHPVWHGLHP